MIENADYFIRLIPMPYGVHGCVSPNEDGTYNVYINDKDSFDRQRQAAIHEIKKHIENDDFAKSDVQEIEAL